MLIVAIGHRKGTGKDTFAKFLASHLKLHTKNKSIKIAGFADKLKDVTYQLFGWAGLKPGIYYEQENTYHEREQKTIQLNGSNYSPRDIWIEFGNHARLWYLPVWRDALLNTNSCDVLIIKDLRFENEVEGVIEQKGILVKIVNPNIPDTDDIADTPLAEYDKWHYEIINNRTKDALAAKARDFGDMILERLKQNG